MWLVIFWVIVSESESCSVVSDSLRSHVLYSSWNFPGQNNGVGSLSLLQGIFPTQGMNIGLQHWRQILYQLGHREPRVIIRQKIKLKKNFFSKRHIWVRGFPDTSVGKESSCNAEDPRSIPGLGRSAGEGIPYPLQYSWVSLVA